MTLRAAVVTVAFGFALPALAQFEGIADVRMSGEQAGGVFGEGASAEGKGKLFLSPIGWRMEVEMVAPPVGNRAKSGKAAGEPYRLVSFGKKSAPKKTWMLNEKTRTYAVIEDEDEATAEDEDQGWKVARLGQDSVAGFSCTNVRATREGGESAYEACLAKDFISGSWLEKETGTDEEWWTAARKAGVTGYPVRIVTKSAAGKELGRFEIVKVERRRIPASAFEVPAGYKEGDFMGVMAQTPEQQAQMKEAQRQAEEAMKNMSPEQKKMMEEMMKKLGSGQRK